MPMYELVNLSVCGLSVSRCLCAVAGPSRCIGSVMSCDKDGTVVRRHFVLSVNPGAP